MLAAKVASKLRKHDSVRSISLRRLMTLGGYGKVVGGRLANCGSCGAGTALGNATGMPEKSADPPMIA